MTAAVPDGFTEMLVALTQLMIDEETLEDTLHRVAYLSCRSPIGADHAGVTLQRERGPATAAYHGDVALELDRSQYESDEGPCLEAFRSGARVHVDVIADASDRWPGFCARAAECGVHSSLSLPLTVRDQTVGALNLYAIESAAFADQSIELGEVFARQAAVAIANAEVYWRTYELAQSLEAALENRDRIGQAKGILIATHKSTGDAAFAMLKRTSQNINVKLRDVADYVVRTGELPTTADDFT